MRHLLALALGVFLTTGLLIAQDHNNLTEKVAKAEIAFSVDTRVGTTMLKAGEYKVACDTKSVTFTRLDDNKKILEVPCKGKQLPAAAEYTVVQTVDKAGVRELDTLILKGSSVEHTFK